MQTAAHPNLSGVHFVPGSPDVVKKKKVTDQNISNFSGNDVSVFDCPKKACAQIQTIGSITEAQGECTNVLFGVGKKTFWVASSTTSPGNLFEYKVGKTDKQVATLTTPSGDYPTGCAINPTTGDLAVPDLLHGHLDIFKGGKGTAQQLSTPLIEAFFAGYDKTGNLYIDGFNSGGTFGFVEMPKGKTTFTTLSGASVQFPGEVQFDGKYITVNDQLAHAIFGYTCSGSACTLKQTTNLTGSSDCDQTWIAKTGAKGYVICPDAGNNNAAEYPYPAGGSAIHTLTGSYDVPLASSAAN
jgi:hypothetical protein